MRIALYPGSFNPIHNGHIAIAKKTLELPGIDEVWMLVSPQSPHKLNHNLWDEMFRLELTKVAIGEIDGIIASDFELSMPKPSYTIDTLEKISKDLPNNSFSLLIGGDNLECIDTWRDGDKILREYGVIVYPRPEFSLPELPKGAKVTILDGEMMSVSSTDIRQKIERRAPLTGLVSPEVEEAIYNNIQRIEA